MSSLGLPFHHKSKVKVKVKKKKSLVKCPRFGLNLGHFTRDFIFNVPVLTFLSLKSPIV
jgi:hypothetical protein